VPSRLPPGSLVGSRRVDLALGGREGPACLDRGLRRGGFMSGGSDARAGEPRGALGAPVLGVMRGFGAAASADLVAGFA